ncbi:Uu.00g120990.m01.CDS01 [Anthostomella pinea]|uniref:Uu.00g120990.m01.CDS01 n=1 Tax=Anthostomella pinea TaxID=933095 RepID=A0AAI8VHW2_9PEZI|nr:Uu.00g120990.m01.CDS01 [Anthostomella pinea]
MPPAISDDEKSDLGDVDVTVAAASKRAKTSAAVSAADADANQVDDGMPDIVAGDVANGDDVAADEDGDGDGDEENLDEDEYIVEKIISHVVDADGSLKYKVKWEGYDKKADQTWEDDDNLRENAAEVLEEYLAKLGGREQVLAEAQTALKTKKRGRPSTGTPTNGTKRRRNDGHPASATPPANARAWKPPQGSWEDDVESIDACHDENTGKLIVYLTWKNGHKTQHETKVIYQRCPQKMLHFYERHVKIVMSSGDGGIKDE